MVFSAGWFISVADTTPQGSEIGILGEYFERAVLYTRLCFIIAQNVVQYPEEGIKKSRKKYPSKTNLIASLSLNVGALMGTEPLVPMMIESCCALSSSLPLPGVATLRNRTYRETSQTHRMQSRSDHGYADTRIQERTQSPWHVGNCAEVLPVMR